MNHCVAVRLYFQQFNTLEGGDCYNKSSLVHDPLASKVTREHFFNNSEAVVRRTVTLSKYSSVKMWVES